MALRHMHSKPLDPVQFPFNILCNGENDLDGRKRTCISSSEFRDVPSLFAFHVDALTAYRVTSKNSQQDIMSASKFCCDDASRFYEAFTT